MRLGEHSKLVDRFSKGVLEMRIGNTIIFLVLIMIAFGFVMSDDLHVRDNNGELVNSNQELSLQNDQMQGNLAICKSTVSKQQQTITELDNEVSTLTNKMLEKEKFNHSPSSSQWSDVGAEKRTRKSGC